MSSSTEGQLSVGVVPSPTGATRITHCREGAGQESCCRNNVDTVTCCAPLDAPPVCVTWSYTCQRAEHNTQHTTQNTPCSSAQAVRGHVDSPRKKPSAGGTGAISRKLLYWCAWGVRLFPWRHTTQLRQLLLEWQVTEMWTPAALVGFW